MGIGEPGTELVGSRGRVDQGDRGVGAYAPGKARSRRTRYNDVIFETLLEALWVFKPTCVPCRKAADLQLPMVGGAYGRLSGS